MAVVFVEVRAHATIQTYAAYDDNSIGLWRGQHIMFLHTLFGLCIRIRRLGQFKVGAGIQAARFVVVVDVWRCTFPDCIDHYNDDTRTRCRRRRSARLFAYFADSIAWWLFCSTSAESNINADAFEPPRFTAPRTVDHLELTARIQRIDLCRIKVEHAGYVACA